MNILLDMNTQIAYISHVTFLLSYKLKKAKMKTKENPQEQEFKKAEVRKDHHNEIAKLAIDLDTSIKDLLVQIIPLGIEAFKNRIK